MIEGDGQPILQDPSDLVDSVLQLLEEAGIPASINDQVVELIEEWEASQLPTDSNFEVCRCCLTAVDSTSYASHPMTDCIGDDGINWADTAIVLCESCEEATRELKYVGQFEEHCKAMRNYGNCF